MESTITLTSVDYAHLIQLAARKKYSQILNRTQINKILFYVYGRYLAEEGKRLFTDDSPKAWPYGPVFPIVNKRINPSDTISFSQEYKDKFMEDKKAIEIINEAVDKMYNKSALQLTQWSHQIGSPWYKTVYGNGENSIKPKWNTEIPDRYIKDYFRTLIK